MKGMSLTLLSQFKNANKTVYIAFLLEGVCWSVGNIIYVYCIATINYSFSCLQSWFFKSICYAAATADAIATHKIAIFK